VQGSEKTEGAVKTVVDGFTQLKTEALEAKVAILAALYGIEKIATGAGQWGTDLQNFSTVTGISTTKVQLLGLEFMKTNASIHDVEDSLLGIQKKMEDLYHGKGVPPYLLNMVDTMNKLGYHFQRGKGGTDTAKYYAEHPEDMLQFINDFLGEKAKGRIKRVTRSFPTSSGRAVSSRTRTSSRVSTKG